MIYKFSTVIENFDDYNNELLKKAIVEHFNYMGSSSILLNSQYKGHNKKSQWT